ncbi:hypothetical protein PIIN_10757 [Serendipita indica DSM 11827]|uniref:Uncharacterized protein n=1 Tax=Serendipita indica (strain DSM 11827) TaxID=1109443 RepID=G4TZM7_SERID|nr:hypothetical protein PIIN_10757 [Serendipita indica DSM 11827]
MNMVCMNLAVN